MEKAVPIEMLANPIGPVSQLHACRAHQQSSLGTVF